MFCFVIKKCPANNIYKHQSIVFLLKCIYNLPTKSKMSNLTVFKLEIDMNIIENQTPNSFSNDRGHDELPTQTMHFNKGNPKKKYHRIVLVDSPKKMRNNIMTPE